MTSDAHPRRNILALTGILIGIAALAFAYYAYSNRLREHPPVEIASMELPQSQAGATPAFTRWLGFEPQAMRRRPALASYYIDAMLGHQVFRIPPAGLPAQLARRLILDDDELLLSSGRRLWNRELLYRPGLSGRFCYIHSSYCLKRLFDVVFFIDGHPVIPYDNQYRIERFPSHTRVQYQVGGVTIDEYKFIAYDDRAVAAYRIRSADGRTHQVTLEVAAPYPPVPGGGTNPGYPLMGRGSFQGIPLFLYLDAPNFERLDGSAVHLRRVLTASADGGTVKAQIAYRFDNEEREPAAVTLDDETLTQHMRDYNRWFADNVPYFDASDAAFKKMWYYRWWVVRLHLTETDTRDLKGYAFYEGKLGFDNVIGFAVPLQLKELSYLRDPKFGLSQVRNSYRNEASNGAVVDPPGSPYWGETYSHWIAVAFLDFERVHPLAPEVIRELLPAMAADVRAWLTTYDSDRDALPERHRPRVTGYDLDILSYWFFNDTKLDDVRPPALERVDFASFVYGNAKAVAELARKVGDQALAQEFEEDAQRVRDAVLGNLWDDQTRFFYPQRTPDHQRAPIRELHGFFPFTMQLAPDDERYLKAMEKFVDPQEFWARFPPVITSLRHYRNWTWEMDGLSRNIAPNPISMGAFTLLRVLKDYHQQHVKPAHFMELMKRYNDLVYPGVHPGDPLWRPNVHEYYSEWEPHSRSRHPKPSDISHDFHSAYCSLVIEGVVGLTPRDDDKIELDPLAREWDYFLLDRLRYRGHDLTIVWDRPGGDVRYDGRPEGFSLYVNDRRVFTRPGLAHVIYDPKNGAVAVVDN